MKKRSYAFIAFTMCIILLAGLTSCGNRNEKNTKNGMNDTSSENVTSAAGEALSEDTDGSSETSGSVTVPSEAADPEKTEEKEQNVQENVPSQTEAAGNAGVQTGTETDAGLPSGNGTEEGTEDGTGGHLAVPTPSVTKASEGGITNVPSKAPAVEAPKVTAGTVTGTPEKNPSSSVTEAPAKEPTKEPVKTPTKEPTKEPTKAPTKDPAKDPTKAPEKTPTKEPTKTPVKEPTKEPTKAPVKVEKVGVVVGYRNIEEPVYITVSDRRYVDENGISLAVKSSKNTLVYYEFYHDDPAKGYPYITSMVNEHMSDYYRAEFKRKGITVNAEWVKKWLSSDDIFGFFITCCAYIGETYGTSSVFKYQIGTEQVKHICVVGDMYSDGTVKNYSEPKYDGSIESMIESAMDSRYHPEPAEEAIRDFNAAGYYFEPGVFVKK